MPDIADTFFLSNYTVAVVFKYGKAISFTSNGAVVKYCDDDDQEDQNLIQSVLSNAWLKSPLQDDARCVIGKIEDWFHSRWKQSKIIEIGK